MGGTQGKEKGLYEVQERAFCPEDKVLRLRPIEGNELQLAWSELVDLLQQNWRAEKSSHSAAAKALKALQCKPLPKKPNIKDIEPDDDNLNASKINQVFEIA